MPTFSGSFSGRTTLQSVVLLKHQPNHELSIAEIEGMQTSSDPLWKDSRITYWGFNDLVDGNGAQRGYFVNTLPNGDTNFGTFEGKVTTGGGQAFIEGTWQFTGGTGQFQNISGGGTFKGRFISLTEVENSWEGAYELAPAAAKATAG